MRTLVKASIPVDKGNQALKEGSLQRTIREFIDSAKPEASYFTVESGRRTALFVLDIPNSSLMPPLLEPLFTTLGAEVSLTPVMNSEELAAGLSKLHR